MDIFIGIIIGIVLSVASVAGLYFTAKYASSLSPPSLPEPARIIPGETNYDTRIDALATGGLERYELHKANRDPAKRKLLYDNPLYADAVSALGWND